MQEKKSSKITAQQWHHEVDDLLHSKKNPKAIKTKHHMGEKGWITSKNLVLRQIKMHTLFNKLVKSPQLFSQKEEDKKKVEPLNPK